MVVLLELLEGRFERINFLTGFTKFTGWCTESCRSCKSCLTLFHHWTCDGWLYDRFDRFIRSIASILVRAVTKRPLLLRRHLQQERRIALRTRLKHGLVPVN